jgi:molybdopterin converting factor small subunit
MALKEEIFKQNTTLFDVLDDNDITQIGSINSRLTDIQNEVTANKLQLDGLARIVDQNQARNESQFVTFNTQITALNNEVNLLSTESQQLSETVDDLNDKFTSLETNVTNEISDVTLLVSNLQQEVNNLDTRVRDNTVNLNLLRSDFNSLQLSFQQTRADVGQLKFDLNLLSNRAKTGIRIFPNELVTMWFVKRGRFTNASIDFRGDPFLRLGKIYTAQLTGSNSELVGLYNIVFAPDDQYEITASAVVPAISGQNYWLFFRLVGGNNFARDEMYLYTV